MRIQASVQLLLLRALMTIAIGSATGVGIAKDSAADESYDDLVALFGEWRKFEHPPLREAVPDYTAETFRRRHSELKFYRDRLAAITPQNWPIAQQVDYHLLRAEMNGFDFNIRVLKPWARDPAFYTSIWTTQSDTPAHEGPTNHAAIELWTYSFPLTQAAEAKLTRELRRSMSGARMKLSRNTWRS